MLGVLNDGMRRQAWPVEPSRPSRYRYLRKYFASCHLVPRRGGRAISDGQGKGAVHAGLVACSPGGVRFGYSALNSGDGVFTSH